jgi:hypothetical protein
MRTTVNLDDDVYAAAKALAESERLPIGRVLSRLVRRSLAPGLRPVRGKRSGFPIIALPNDSPPVSAEAVRRALDDDR